MYDTPPSPVPLTPLSPNMPPPTSHDTKPRHRRKKSLIDELLPLPTPSQAPHALTFHQIVRRIVSVAVLAVFLATISFLAITNTPQTSSTGLRSIFGMGRNGDTRITQWIAEGDGSDGEIDTDGHKGVKIDFEQYKMIQTLKSKDFDILSLGKRLIFIGDIHGALDPLHRLLNKLDYKESDDRIVHVGDLVAKGKKNVEVLEWMRRHNVVGVRGNHDQPVIEWRTWMEWAGQGNWEEFVDGLDTEKSDEEEDDDGDDDGEDIDEGSLDRLTALGKVFPKHWKWKSQHWKIARQMTKDQYKYLVDLPLALHIPSLHSFVVHAGLLPHNPLKSLEDPSQPLVAAAETDSASPAAARLKEELSLLKDIPQNTDPWTLINMRSVYIKGKKKGKITKSTKKGMPWSGVWQEEMERCTRKSLLSMSGEEDQDVEDRDDDEDMEVSPESRKKLRKLQCSPVTVIYGHAAARGLDIKDFSKGIDTGCVYGHSLTALVLGDTSGLKGDHVSVGNHQGVLVSVDCRKGGK